VLEVRNDGTADLRVSATDIGGTDEAEFLVAAGGGSFVVAPGASRAIEVRWSPLLIGTKSAALRLTSDDPDEPSMEVSLSGRAVGPDIGVDPGDLDFGAILVGSVPSGASRGEPASGAAPGEGAEIEFLVVNEGTAPLVVQSPVVEGPDASAFRIVDGAREVSIAPGGSHRIVVRAAVTTLGPKSAELRLASDDPDEALLRLPVAARGVRVLGPSDADPAPSPGREASEPSPSEASGPLRAAVTGIHPNPSTGAAAIEFALPAASPVTVVVYDANGRRVRTVVDAVLPAGLHATQWDSRDDFGRSTASGIYFVRLTAGDRSSIAKLVLRR
jgi:hypothetical protein